MRMNGERGRTKRGERRGSSPDASLTPHAARGRMPTFLPRRLFRPRGWSQASRDSLGGDLRVEGKEEKSLLYTPSSSHRSVPASEPREGDACGGASGGARWGSRPARECGALRTSQTRALLSPGPCWLSLTSFLGISPKRESVFLLGTSSPWPSVLPYTTDQGCEWGPQHSSVWSLKSVSLRWKSVQPDNMRPEAQSPVTKRKLRMEWKWTLCRRRLGGT